MDRRLKLRVLILFVIWLPLAIFSTRYAIKKNDTPRFEFLLSTSGVVSSLQREDWLQSSTGVQPQDRILSVGNLPFEVRKVRAWLSEQSANQNVLLKISRDNKETHLPTTLRRYSKNDLIILFFLPLVISIIFLGFSLGVTLSREARLKSQEAVEIFSIICFSISLFFLILFPAQTLGLTFPFGLFAPFLAALITHLFVVYPKKKGQPKFRYALLALNYGVVFLMAVLRVLGRPITFWAIDFFVGTCVLVALGSVGNTLLTSRDFWARRRARLLSLAMLITFVTATTMFWAFMWEVPRLSVERILAASLIFPAAFSGIFLKENVFDLERIFKRGAHQVLVLGMAVTFALLVGLGWNEWGIHSDREWMLWVAIAIVVIAVARPVGAFFESKIHSIIQTKVFYPKVDKAFEDSVSLHHFLTEVGKHFETYLNMENVAFAFFQDPTQKWTDGNVQVWTLKKGELLRVYSNEELPIYTSTLFRGSVAIGEIRFDGDDSLAFDPYSSPDWAATVRDIARCVEILCLREFISIQQSFLAVGRMQSLLAHQMKNPLAIIKVCAGLLNSHIKENEEAEELVKTIQDEVGRVSAAIQGVFEHASRVEEKQKTHLGAVLAQVKENVLSRFADCEVEISYWSDGERDEAKSLVPIYIERDGLRQALNNLVVNAFEAGSSWVGIEIHFSPEDFSLVVRDRGPGLLEKVDLFKPFVTTKSHGTGLGLAHVKAFMDRNSGQIKVISKRGEGTIFTLDFPKQFVLNENV
jgi:signal transduction histidine kinase